MKIVSRFLTICLAVLSGSVALAQQVSGTVFDEYNEPLPSVAITVENGGGTMTDFNGQYNLSLGNGTYNITYSFVGYESATKSVNVNGNKVVNVTLKPSKTQLDEVVVVGYGVARKSDLTGSVVSLKTKELTDIPTPSFENAIQGKAAGVQVITGSGIAGSGSMVRVRGVASISAGGDPLYVIKLDADNRQVIVGPKESLSTRTILIKEINWLGEDNFLDSKERSLSVRVRSTRSPKEAIIRPISETTASVELIMAVEGIAPGQACVFYDNESTRIYGGGWITDK